jgi:hypothetical protein
VFWDVVGASLPSSIFLKYGIKAYKWRKESSKIKPYLLLMHLDRSMSTKRRPPLVGKDDSAEYSGVGDGDVACG